MSWKAPLRTTVLYVSVAAIWIWVSDRAAQALVSDPATLSMVQSIKGWAFVLFTGFALYWLIWHDLRRLALANRTLIEGHEQSMRALVSAMDVRHKETRDHTERVTRMTVELARLAGLEGRELTQVRFGALLHDIGKLSIPDAILIKPGKLDDAEMEMMRRHPEIARDMLEQVDFLRDAVDIPHAHHERWDGQGYPRGLRGEAIPLAARLFSVVDIWDALSFQRVYKPAWPEDEVLDYLREAAGRQLDPALVELFLDNYTHLKRVGLDGLEPAEVR